MFQHHIVKTIDFAVLDFQTEPKCAITDIVIVGDVVHGHNQKQYCTSSLKDDSEPPIITLLKTVFYKLKFINLMNMELYFIT
ncbi:hypothetical protein ATO12_04200 [Aquimarina atlantica]|uniref:Uncharacterized protein n=1 Tax=Aquimarina atlantica TaxID=1317122 RepID=A0A023C186_9FLAO|nr:hypothetical protein ATO12_04200 [Aquimarina atlantica]